MDSDSTHMVTASRVPMLKTGEYEIWKMRIQQYIRMVDYSLWEVVLYGGSQPAKTATGSVLTLKTSEEKAQRRLEVKAYSILMMGIPNDYQLSFNHIESAKDLWEAIELRFGGNEATQKSRKNLLKHQFETFTALSSENIEGTYDRLHKLSSQMALLKIEPSQEDINLKFLRSLSSEWNTHTVVWRHKEDFENMTLDDLYNNLKVY